MTRTIRFALLVLTALLGACSQSTDSDRSTAQGPVEATGTTPAAAAPRREELPAATPAEDADEASELAGTAWQLVEIVSMDDTVYIPDDPSRYTLRFAEDGRVSIDADCNKATGSWSSESPGRLEFSPLAATMAACPPGSIYDTYLAQFQWVRSYVFDNGNLFLATMADGSIIEFEPLRR